MIFCISAWMTVGAFVFAMIEYYNITRGYWTLWEYFMDVDFDTNLLGRQFRWMSLYRNKGPAFTLWLITMVVMMAGWPVLYHRLIWRM